MAALVLRGAEDEVEELVCKAGGLVEYEEGTEVDTLLEAFELACEEELDFAATDALDEVDEVIELFEDTELEVTVVLVLGLPLDPIQNSADTNPPPSCPS